jgi:hypothetical protein
MEEHPAKNAPGHEEKPDPWDDAPASDPADVTGQEAEQSTGDDAPAPAQPAGHQEKPAPWDD